MTADRISILYVDDEPDIRTIGEMSLKLDPTIDVRTVASGEEAIALLTAPGAIMPDLLLLDVTMPGMDGPELLENIRARCPTVPPVIFMTARAQSTDIRQYLGLGAIDVIIKPFDPMQLARQIRAILSL